MGDLTFSKIYEFENATEGIRPYQKRHVIRLTKADTWHFKSQSKKKL